MDLSSLNEKQLQAVTAPLGPVLVLAGAGSGKTRVLTFRIAYLIEQGMVPPEQILAVTFTNKAAKEMQTRIMHLLSEEKDVRKVVGQPTLGTFHSIGARMLRKEIARLGYSSNFVILDTDDQLKIIRDIVSDLNIPKQYGPTLFRAYISSAKNLLQTPQEMNVGLEGYLHDLVQQVYVRYQNFIYKQNSLDFDDLLMLPIKLWEAFPDVLRKYQQTWQYVLVDEYQDTNQAQYMFLHMLAKNQNLFVVGDDAQSIYGFRGSNIGNILNFEKDFPSALVVKLEQNYRSTKNILAAAQKVIELNSEQKPKTLWTENDHGDKVTVEEVFDGRAEAIYVARKIVQMVGSGEEEPEYEDEPESQTFSILDQFLAKQRRTGKTFGVGVPQLPMQHKPLYPFAVLYRTHAQSRQLEEVFIEAGIPYQIVGGVKFYERKEIKDLLAFIRLVVNPRDLISLKRVVNLPPRGIGEKSFGLIRDFIFNMEPAISSTVILREAQRNEGSENRSFANAQDDSISNVDGFLEELAGISLPQKQRESLFNFYSTIRTAAAVQEEAPLTDLMRVIVKISRMEDYLRDGTENGEARVENVHEMFNVAAKFDHLPWQVGVIDFLEEVALITDLDSVEDQKDSVTLMTLHAAKGLEFDVVFFVGLEEGILPHSQSLMDPSELAEEVRLAYVGLTRARQRLFLVYAQTRQMYGSFQSNPPSRILRALPLNAVHLKGNASSLLSDSDNYTYEPF